MPSSKNAQTQTAQSDIQKQHASLFWQILRWTLVTLFSLAGIAGTFSFWSSYHESRNFQQENLKNIATLIFNNDVLTKTDDPSTLTKPNHVHYKTDNEEGGLGIDMWIIPVNYQQINLQQIQPDHASKSTTQSLSWQQLQTIPNGLSSQTLDNTPWQVYRLDETDSQRRFSKTVVIRQNSDLQQELSQNSALQSALPLVLAMLIFLALLYFVMWRAFRPVEKLAQTINQRPTHDLSPLPLAEIPKEILPFGNAINTLLIKIKANVDAEQRFIADASHELRSPLTATSLQLQRIQRLTTDEKITLELNKLSLRVKRNQDLVEQLLTLARLNAEQAVVTTTAIVPLIEQTINLLLPIVDHKKIELALTIEPTYQSLQMQVDATAMLILIKNLLQNAVLYTPRHGKVSINLTDIEHCCDWIKSQSDCIIGQSKQRLSDCSATQPILQITDTGMGIEKFKYKEVFEPFVRLTATHSQTTTEVVGGTGLGLAMVKTICEQTGIVLFLSPSLPPQHPTEHANSHPQGLCITLLLPPALLSNH